MRITSNNAVLREYSWGQNDRNKCWQCKNKIIMIIISKEIRPVSLSPGACVLWLPALHRGRGRVALAREAVTEKGRLWRRRRAREPACFFQLGQVHRGDGSSRATWKKDQEGGGWRPQGSHPLYHGGKLAPPSQDGRTVHLGPAPMRGSTLWQPAARPSQTQAQALLRLDCCRRVTLRAVLPAPYVNPTAAYAGRRALTRANALLLVYT